MAEIGSTLKPSKSEVVLAAGSSSTVSLDAFQGWQICGNGNFKLLGAPIGDANCCETLTAKRADKVALLLDKLADFSDRQGAVLLLRHCASWSELVYSSRATPPTLHINALQTFARTIRTALEHIIGEGLPEHCLNLAQLSVSKGGLGLRDAHTHAPAAFLASVMQSESFCKRVGPLFDISDSDGALGLHDAQSALCASMLEAACARRGPSIAEIVIRSARRRFGKHPSAI